MCVCGVRLQAGLTVVVHLSCRAQGLPATACPLIVLANTMSLKISTIDMRSYEHTVWCVLVKGAIQSSIETNGSAVAVVLWSLFCVVVLHVDCYFRSWMMSQVIHTVL